jgi:hypothetical protein
MIPNTKKMPPKVIIGPNLRIKVLSKFAKTSSRNLTNSYINREMPTNMRIFSKSINLAVSAAIAIASVGAADSNLFDKAGGDVIVESAAVCDGSYATQRLAILYSRLSVSNSDSTFDVRDILS